MTIAIRPTLRFAAATAVLLAAAVAVPLLPASAKDDPAKIKADRDALRKELKDKKLWITYDLSYSVDPVKLKESRWDWKDPPPEAGPDPSEKKGFQFHADLMTAAGVGDVAVKVTLFKGQHYQMVGSARQPFDYPFSAWGKNVSWSAVDKMAEGFYEDWTRSATDVIKEKCTPAKKKAVGPAEYWASAVGTDKESKKRERREWYLWGTTGAGIPCTWIGEVTIAEKFIDNEDFVRKSEDIFKNLKEITDKRAKQTP